MSPSPSQPKLPDDLAAKLPSLDPLPTAAERAADVIRNNIYEGRFQPGTSLPETMLAQALHVSRNTVREAFRTLMNEKLLRYQAHRGVTVNSLTLDDVRDIYRLRKTHELSAIDLLRADEAALDSAPLVRSVTAAQEAAAAEDWLAVGTANLHFHEHIVALHGSPRMNEFFRQLMVELRLGFMARADPRAFHAPYLERNQKICDDLATGRLSEARAALEEYLDVAQQEVSKAVAAA